MLEKRFRVVLQLKTKWNFSQYLVSLTEISTLISIHTEVIRRCSSLTTLASNTLVIKEMLV